MVRTQFGGTVMGESAMVNTSDVGSLVEFTFIVSHLHHSDYIRPPILYITSRICASHPHFLHLHPVFDRFFFIPQKFNIVWGRDCYVSYGLWCKHDQGWILFRSHKVTVKPWLLFHTICLISTDVCTADFFPPPGKHERSAVRRPGDPGCGVWVALWGCQWQVAAVPDTNRH